MAKHRARDRREARRRQHQSAVAAERRAERRRLDEVRQSVEVKLAELSARAGDPTTDPAAVVELAASLVADPLVGRLLGRPAFGFQTASSLLDADDDSADDDSAAAVDPDVERSDRPEDAKRLARQVALAEAFTAAAEVDRDLIWMAAGAWDGAGHAERAEAIVAPVVTGAPPDDEAYRAGAAVLASLRLQLGRLADALDFLLDAATALPEQEDVHLMSAIALGLAWRSQSAPAEDPCTCGSDQPAGTCCQPRLAAQLQRFDDRSRVDRLTRAVQTWVTMEPDRQRLLDGEVEAFSDELLGDPDEEPSPLAKAALVGHHRRLAEQRAWLLAGPDDDSDDDEATLLGQFAGDPATPPDLAADARAWLERTTYGLWQVADPRPAPGVWLLELLTGRRLYVSAPPGQLDGLARWSVLLGPVVCLDGIWRTTEGMAVLGPAEADEVAALVGELFEALARAIGEQAGVKPERRRTDPDPLPAGVVAGLMDPVDAATATALGRLVCAALGTLLGELESGRRQPPTLQNTDGDPLDFLSARMVTDDPESLRHGLLARDDFEADGDTLVWFGRELTPMERETSMAKVREEARARGWSEPEEPEEPRRWVRGTLRFEGSDLLIEVNSRRRLDRLGDILCSLGMRGAPTIERRVDPARDLPAPRGRLRTGRSLGQEADAAWRASWLDEPVPALGGLSPRRAAEDPTGRLRLEALLRCFEHDGDLASSEGVARLDVGTLRDALGLADGL